MTRRGLQIFLGILLLGAAPLFGQQFPPFMSLSGFPDSFDGTYVQTAGSGVNGSQTWQRWSDDGSPVRYMSVVRFGTVPETWRIILHLTYAAGWWENQYAQSPIITAPTLSGSVTGFLKPGNVSIQGTAFIASYPPDHEYSQAFPDWASARIRIPLGFAFGLSLWAVTLAFGVPMRWVRDLTSAAS